MLSQLRHHPPLLLPLLPLPLLLLRIRKSELGPKLISITPEKLAKERERVENAKRGKQTSKKPSQPTSEPKKIEEVEDSS